MTYFLLHIQQRGETTQIIETTPYRATQLAVAPDASVWTVGLDVPIEINGKKVQRNHGQNILRHFDRAGKFIASDVPLNTVNRVQCYSGYIVATQDRIGWYSPATGSGTYVEFTPDMKVVDSYQTPFTAVRYSTTWGFALTPSGSTFVVVHPTMGDAASVFYELDRNAKTWIPVQGVPVSQTGLFPMLDGNDGESLSFKGPPDKSKLQVVNIVR